MVATSDPFHRDVRRLSGDPGHRIVVPREAEPCESGHAIRTCNPDINGGNRHLLTA